MDKTYYLIDSKKFWETREKARKAKDKKLAGLPFSKKASMVEKLQADYELLQNAKGETKQFGLGDIPDATNELSIDLPFSGSDFEIALNELFPFTQELQADQEPTQA